MNKLTKHFESKQHVIWDWNGTLLDDVDLCVDVINGLLQRHSLPRITKDAYRKKFRFPIVEYYKTIGFDLELTPFEGLAAEFISDYADAVPTCLLFEGAAELLGSLKEGGKSCSILSAAKEYELKQLTKHHGIHDRFEHIYGLSDHYAVSKIERGHELIHQLGLPKEKLIIVGDTDHDIEVARALGVDLVLLGDGHQEYERLSPLHPETLVSRYH